MTPDDFLVLEYAGPKCSHAMPEPGYPDPANLAGQGIKAMMRVSDARMCDLMNGFS